MEQDVASFGEFGLYVGALGISGLLMLIIGIVSSSNRIINLIVGAAATGYAGYLLYSYLFTAGTFEYQIFLYAYILPFIAIFMLISAIRARGKQPAEPAPSPEG